MGDHGELQFHGGAVGESGGQAPFIIPDVYTGGLIHRENDIFIAVMGATGAGKSTFISHCTDREVPVSDSLHSCTEEITVYPCVFNSSVNVYLIDTPGFDDSRRSTTEILREIASFLAQSYSNKIRLNGVLYLHDMAHNRMAESSLMNLALFKRICAGGTEDTEIYRNIIFVTTRWEALAPDALRKAEEHSKELRETDNFWGKMMAKGARYYRHANSRESAISLIGKFVPESPTAIAPQVTLAIQHEMVDQKLSLDETSAGQTMNEALKKLEQKYEKELSVLREENARALAERDREMQEYIHQSNAEVNAKIKSVEEETRRLATLSETKWAQRMEQVEEERKRREQELEESRKLIRRLTDGVEDNQSTSSPSAEGPPPDYTTGETSSTTFGGAYVIESQVVETTGVYDDLESAPKASAFETEARQSMDSENPNSENHLPPSSGTTIARYQEHGAASTSVIPFAPKLASHLQEHQNQKQQPLEPFRSRTRHKDWALIEACEEGGPEGFQFLQKRYTPAELAAIRCYDNQTLLHIAASRGRTNILDFLLSIPPVENCLSMTDSQGRKPIHCAVVYGSLSPVTTILKRMTASEVCTLDSYGATPLVRAIFSQNETIVNTLKGYYTPGLPIIYGDALSDLIQVESIAVLRRFLAVFNTGNQAFWDIKDEYENNLLHIALAGSPSPEKLQLILSTISRAPLSLARKLVFQHDFIGLTPLGGAAALGRNSNIATFLDSVGRWFPVLDIVNYISPMGSAYFLAITRGHGAMAKMLASKYQAKTNQIEICGLSTQSWIESVIGLPIRPNPLNPMKSYKILPFSPYAIIVRDSDRQKLLKLEDDALIADPLKLIYLAMHHFILTDKRVLKGGNGAKLPHANKSKLALDIGVTLYAMSRYFGQRLASEYGSCDSCSGAITARFYTCVSCFQVDYCEQCQKVRPKNKVFPYTQSHCSKFHYWALVDIDSYNFKAGLTKGYQTTTDLQTIPDFFSLMRKLEKEGTLLMAK